MWTLLVNILKYTFAAIGALVLLVVAFSLFISLSKMNNPSVTIKTTPDLIDCFVDGKAIKATRDTCADLSLRNNSQPTNSQSRQIAPLPQIQAPQIEIPKRQPAFQQTNCHQFYDGSVSCYSNSY